MSIQHHNSERGLSVPCDYSEKCKSQEFNTSFFFVQLQGSTADPLWWRSLCPQILPPSSARPNRSKTPQHWPPLRKDFSLTKEKPEHDDASDQQKLLQGNRANNDSCARLRAGHTPAWRILHAVLEHSCRDTAGSASLITLWMCAGGNLFFYGVENVRWPSNQKLENIPVFFCAVD